MVLVVLFLFAGSLAFGIAAAGLDMKITDEPNATSIIWAYPIIVGLFLAASVACAALACRVGGWL